MKKWFLITILMFMLACPVFAQDTTVVPSTTIVGSIGDAVSDVFNNLTVKQGGVYVWNDGKLKNTTTYEVLVTTKIDSIGKWNALWEGISLDVGPAYDALNSVDGGVIMIGKNINKFGDYLPINFPFKDQITLTVQPIGLYFTDSGDKWNFKTASGIAYVQMTIKFGPQGN